MAAITGTVLAATAIAGIGMQAYGMSKQQEGLAEQRRGQQIQAQGSMVQAQAAEQASGGSLRQVEGAKEQNAATKAIVGLEFQAEEQRRRAMELDARRRNLEIVRMHQRANAIALTTANAQGAARGSGLQGAYGQTSGQTGFNLTGVSQQLEIGRNMFGINQDISNQRLAYARGGDIINEGAGIIAQSQGLSARGAGIIAQGGGIAAAGAGISAYGQGLSSFGGSLVNAAPTFGNVAGSLTSMGQSAYSTYISPFQTGFGINTLGRG
jgi:hypothetical protein